MGVRVRVLLAEGAFDTEGVTLRVLVALTGVRVPVEVGVTDDVKVFVAVRVLLIIIVGSDDGLEEYV